MNKRGAEKMLSVYWFAILIIVSGGIFAMTVLFYGHPLDVRNVEANLLLNKIADCISWEGKMNPALFSQGSINQEFSNNFLERCSINFNSEFGDVPQYYFEAELYSFNNPEILLSNIIQGNRNLKEDCKLKNGIKYEKVSKCAERSLYVLDEKSKQYLIKILTAVKKTEKNVK